MRRLSGWRAGVVGVALCCVLAAPVSAEQRDGHPELLPSARAGSEISEAPRLTQRQDGWGWGGGRSLWRRLRGTSNHQKNHDDIKSVYERSAETAARATADVLVNGEVVALATLVDGDGYLVTKASLLEKVETLACRFASGEPITATLIGVDQEYDLALLKADRASVADAPAAWRAGPAEPGTFVAAVEPDGDIISVGVISTEPREIRGTGQVVRRRAWLGVSLGGGESGTGVTEVVERSPAQRAGLRAGDLIQGIDGNEMTSMEQIVSTIGAQSVGAEVALLVRRDGEVLELSATLGRPPEGLDPQDQWGGGPFSERRDGFPEVLTHDTIIRPEQCGGPLVDIDGNMVGVNIARALRVTTYAVPAATLQRLVSELKRN